MKNAALLLLPFALCAVHCAEPTSPDPGGRTDPAGAEEDAPPAPTGSPGEGAHAGERPAPSAASETDAMSGLGTWAGRGVSHDRAGEPLGAFEISLERREVGAIVRTEGTVTLADGRRIPFWQELEPGNRGFRLRSGHGEGGGRCFGNAMCQTYEVKGEHAVATTIAMDGPGSIRVLVTELSRGVAVRFAEQALHKIR
jgi:hypothetical protein